MINWDTYRESPAKVLGMKKYEALAYLAEHDFPGTVAREDGRDSMVLAIVQILLHVKDGVVVGSELDGDSHGVW